MASSPVFESDYLQRRFNERRAEARVNRQASEQQSNSTDSSHRRNPGYDDNIFDDPDILPISRKSLSSRYQSSPNGPVGQRAINARRTSNMASSIASTPRMLGAREMEDKVDKLEKQNFDLKLEVDNRRERVKTLEKKLVEMEQLREENAELTDINQELLCEMDKRDRAVDEAVVMICDLEAKVRAQQEELDDMRPRTASQGQVEGFKSSPRHTPRQSTLQQHNIPRSTSDNGNRNKDMVDVSPDVSARAAAPADSRQSGFGQRKQVPSFIQNGTAATDALRSMYLEGNKQVRPIPSYASLLTNDLDDGRASMKSPALSEISESEFKSLYGDKEERIAELPYDTTPERESDADAASHTSSQLQRSRLARTDKWVKERGVSPDPQPDIRKQNSGQFQSLGHLLHDDIPSPERRRNKGAAKPAEDTTLNVIRQNPMFGQNCLPPTPDTMQTGPSNKSSSSIIRERSINDNAPLTRGLSSLIQPVQDNAYFAKGTFLPKDADAFGSDSDDEPQRKGERPVTNNSFGESLYNPDGYNSDSGTAMVQAPRSHRAGVPTALKFDRQISSRRPSVPSGATSRGGKQTHPLPERPLIVAVDVEPRAGAGRPQSRRRSISDTPTQATFTHSRYIADPTPTTFVLTPNLHGLQRVPVADASTSHRLQAPVPRQSTPPSTTDPTTVIANDSYTVASALSRTDSIRQRVANLTRRHSATNSAASGVVKSEVGSAPPSVGANLSKRTRQFFRRNSKGKTEAVTGTSDGRSGSAIESDIEDADAAAVTAQIKPPMSNSIPTAIPVYSPTNESPPKRNQKETPDTRDVSREQSTASSLSWRTAALHNKNTPEELVADINRKTTVVSPTAASGASRARRESGSRPFPRR